MRTGVVLPFQKKNMKHNGKSPKIALYRILGNDLPPRHKIGQTYNNLRFMLDHEPNFPYCQKKWIVNRIVDVKMEQKIINLLKKYKQPYIRIPFCFQEYQACKKKKIADHNLIQELKSEFDYERHNEILYVMNINGAKNVALRDGKQIADWILPFDGGCCFTEQGWRGVIDKLSVQKTIDKCFAVPTYRLTNNEQYFNFNPEGYAEHESMIIFGKSSDIEFNESYRYGKNNKIKLFKKLGFKLQQTDYATITVDSKYKCGYNVRLFSGVIEGEGKWLQRAVLREKAIDLMIQKLDKPLILRRVKKKRVT